jgi:PPM family protein phosphatase
MILMLHVVNFVLRSEKKRRGDRMKAVFMTDKGKIRQHNEDNGGIFINLAGQRLGLVADGMGGHRAGDVASAMTIASLKGYWEQTNRLETAEESEQWLKDHIKTVNSQLFEHSQINDECEGMGTTLVAAICTNRFISIAHIGDSRCYLSNELGFNQVTEDHSLVNELVRTGQISKEDAEHHPRKNVLLRALGTEAQVDTDIKTITFEEGDCLLLCSDGLSNKVKETAMVEVLSQDNSLAEKAAKLIEIANHNGGEDNITLVIVEFYDDTESGE